ncbi:FAD-dependent oxidoreductase [Vitreoscilla stercoraria]|uniref:FAD-binding protein n=1 Tax=Vitreoscilla stercoraria TaxID=61 RepID=A0ABY4EGK5_VITST|nr:FAD-binding protein [Vitreoscilla stercoraria]UOO92532.1 FAD-binding protein [Vitreoscilla stercoraria]
MAFAFQAIKASEQKVDHRIQADVLVIGGSIAGCWAAMVARQNGAERVVVCDKSRVGVAGVVAQASGSAAYLIPGADEYNEKLVHSRHLAAEGMDNLDFVRYVFGESYKIALELQKLGFVSPVNRPDINGVRSNLLAFDGHEALGFFRQLLLSAGVTILDESPALELLRHQDGNIVGANGVHKTTEKTWSVLAGAVILATGGNAFRSGAMGTHDTTGDGHLFAAEAGAQFSGMEFSGHYGISPLGSTTTKGFWLSSASFYDANGQELQGNGWESVHTIGQAILDTGGAFASMNKANEGLKIYAKNVPSIYHHFQNLGIDPYTEKFPIELRYEGLVRSVGGIVVDEHAQTGIPGLYAVGDVTERSKMTGAAMSGAGPAIAWCLVSAKKAGKHAAT